VLRDITVFPPQGSQPEILRYMGLESLWKAGRDPCAAVELEIKAETPELPWRMVKFRTKIRN